MDEKSRAFLTEGFRVYPEACRAIRSFYEELRTSIRAILCEKDDWSAFHPSAGDDAFSFSQHNVTNTSNLWIAGFIWGQVEKVEQRAKLELGLWWEPPIQKVKVVLYTNFIDPEGLRTFTPRTKDKKARASVLGGKTRVFIPYDEPGEDLTADANLILGLLQQEIRQGR